jgi:hypothetical protein
MERLHGLLEIQDSLKNRTLERKVTRETKHLEKLDSWIDSNPGETEPLSDRTLERQDKWGDCMTFWRYVQDSVQTGHWRDRSQGETELLKRLDSQKDRTPGEFGLQMMRASWSDWTPGELRPLKRLDSRCDWTPESLDPKDTGLPDWGSLKKYI